MLRQRIQLKKALLISSLTAALKSFDNATVTSIDNQMTRMVNEVADIITTIELSSEEQQKVLKAYNSKDTQILQTVLSDVEKEFRNRFFETVLTPAMKRIHHLRLLAIFLDRTTYNDYILKTASLFDAFSQIADQVALGLLKIEIQKLNAAYTEAEKARSEYNAFGSTIEE